MKTDLSYLPQHKQEELSAIVAGIRETATTEMIILFGSYARNDWVEDKYDDEHYRYQSDFDILVIIESKSEFAQAKLERDIESWIDQNSTIHTPVSILVHDIDFVNRRLSKAQYFFTDIKKEGIFLYDSGKYKLSEAKELLPGERKKLAKEDFDYWFKNANSYYRQYELAMTENELMISAFLLHQVTERLYTAILLVFTRYKPNTHDLLILRKLANSVDSRLVRMFPLDSSESMRLFKLLRKAYVDARYKPSYLITKDELLQLANQVEQLKEIGKMLCIEKIDSF